MIFHKHIIEEWVGDKTEVHLLSLGQLGNIYEQIDGTVGFVCLMTSDNVIGVYSDLCPIKKYDWHITLEEHLRTHMFEYMLKLKKKYGSFKFTGKILNAPHEWADADGTITLSATKYHKAMLGKKGMVVINKILFTNSTDELLADDALNELKLYFNLTKNKGFTCITKEQTIPTESHDTIVSIDKDDVIGSVERLARNNKSIVNGSILVSKCYVNGYTIETKNGKRIQIENDEWREIVDANLAKWNSATNYFFELKHKKSFDIIISDDEIMKLVEMFKDFLYDETLPKGVRLSRLKIAERHLTKICEDFSFLKYYNELITKPS